MKIIIANKKGINDIVDETLAELPLNQRYDRIKGQFEEGYEHYKNETLPYKVKVLPKIGSYSQNLLMSDERTVSRTIDLIGPYEDVPDFLIASNSKEKKEILNRPIYEGSDPARRGKLPYHGQMQMTVLDEGIFVRYLGHQDELNASTIFAIPVHTPKKNDEHFNKYDEHFASIHQSVWESNVELMTDYFLKSQTENYKYTQNNKIILGSEKCMYKVLDIFEKKGLHPVTEKTRDGD